MLAERAGGGARLVRQRTDTAETALNGVLELPAFVWGCPEGMSARGCADGSHLHVSADGRTLVVTWQTYDSASTDGVGTSAVVVRLDAPWAADMAPMVVHQPSVVPFLEPAGDRVTFVADDGLGAAQSVRVLSVPADEGATPGSLGQPLALPMPVYSGFPVGDGLATDRYLFGSLSNRAPAWLYADRGSRTVAAIPSTDTQPSGPLVAPSRRLAGWLDTDPLGSAENSGRDQRIAWHSLAIDAEGRPAGSLPTIELPIPRPGAYFPELLKPSVAFTPDAEHVLVAAPWSDLVVRID